MVANPYKQIVPGWVLAGTAIFTLVAMAELPYGAYQLLRWVVCAVSAAMAVQMYQNGRTGWIWALGGVAVLFNPLAKIHFEKETWMVLDGLTGLMLFAALVVAYRDKNRPNGTAGRPERG